MKLTPTQREALEIIRDWSDNSDFYAWGTTRKARGDGEVNHGVAHTLWNARLVTGVICLDAKAYAITPAGRAELEREATR